MPTATDRCKLIEFVDDNCSLYYSILKILAMIYAMFREETTHAARKNDPVASTLGCISGLLLQLEGCNLDKDIGRATILTKKIESQLSTLGTALLGSTFPQYQNLGGKDRQRAAKRTATAAAIAIYAGLVNKFDSEPECRRIAGQAAHNVYLETLKYGGNPNPWQAIRLRRLYKNYGNRASDSWPTTSLMYQLLASYRYDEVSDGVLETLSLLRHKFASNEVLVTIRTVIGMVERSIGKMRTNTYEPPSSISRRCSDYLWNFLGNNLVRALHIGLIYYAALLEDPADEPEFRAEAMLLATSLFYRSIDSQTSFYLDSTAELALILRGSVEGKQP